MPRYIAAVRNDAVDAIKTYADGGSIEFRTGSAPTDPGDAATGTLLATVDAQNPAFGAATDGEVTAQGLPRSTTGDDDGTIGYARILDSASSPVYDEDDVSTSAGSKITVNTTTVSTGVDLEVTNWVLRARNPTS